MPRRVKKHKPFWVPIADYIKERFSETHIRTRRRVIKYALWGVSILFLYSLMAGTYSIPRILKLNLERRALMEANRQYTTELADAARIRQLLKSDPSYIEYIARTRYRMVRPDEIIFRYRGR